MNLYNGLKMTEEILLNTLKRHGLEKVDPMGEAFDPNKHEAVFQVPMPDKEPGTVFNVQEIGFALNGRTIRVCFFYFFSPLHFPHLYTSPANLGDDRANDVL